LAARRMFAKTIIDSDAFLEMPQSTQLLYFHLSMRADDDGFMNKPKSLMSMVGCKDDDLRILISKKFILPFESGIIVIKHWRLHNYIAKDRYTETKYKDEKSLLSIDENNSYVLNNGMYTECIQVVDELETQVRLGKDRIGKDIKEKVAYAPFVHMTTSEYEQLITQLGEIATKNWIEDVNLWKGSKGKTTKSDYMTILNWARRDEKQKAASLCRSTIFSSSRI